MWSEGSTSEHVRRLQSVTDAALAHLRLDDLLAALLERTTGARVPPLYVDLLE